MKKMPARIILAVAPFLVGMRWDSGGLGGLMVQPDSQYYHYISGVYAGISSEKKKLCFRSSFLQRSPYQASGFRDEEHGYFSHLGTLVAGSSQQGLLLYLGAGEMRGSLQKTGTNQKRSYNITGFSLQTEYGVQLGGFYGALTYHNFIGIQQNNQVQAFVAWPFNYLFLRLGLEL